ncbi:hypothetical protein [Novosphingobium album (ex Hu et al. 2023)]|uniref:Outer membrane assembly lipoprotein YfiO n=1 Tax=Novosphingobium album (ex Hu et al. 2023) TaxID=2930093 RepID=A0ABT0AZM6_9SPHN|nr:hypothetical protein [Novosphingobium album (ex Hu et al. 2023)]MCJ2178095.1 hypothetical protein [Novosphingobium album (ex Hu et al. 2023)]
MKRRILAAGALLALAAWPQLAGASGDFGCYPSWRLGLSDYECAGSAIIGPRNDTRINLAWLLRERAGLSAPGKLSYPTDDWASRGFGHVFMSWDTMQSTFWPRPETQDEASSDETYSGSRCQTLGSGDAAFRTALAAGKGLKSGEREALSDARDLVKAACDGDRNAAEWPAQVTSRTGLAFLAYLQGARAFYAEDFATAGDRFAALAKAKDPWLAETARYMTARTELAAAQAGAFDKWGFYDNKMADKAAAQRGQTALADYLSAYPQGRYAASAQGLKRRAAWLMGEALPLTQAYSGLLARQPQLDAATPGLMEEVDNKLFFGAGLAENADAPLLLATWDLLRMRQGDPELAEYRPKPLTTEELAAQAPVFAKDPGLYTFLQASHAFYAAKDYRRVLTLIPDDARRTSYTSLAFSRQMLRGLALEALGDRNAAGFWRELSGGAHDLYQHPAVELALAMNRERHGELAEVFAAGSPVTDPDIRTRLLEQVAGPDLLRQQVRGGASALEREAALFMLLYKELSRGRYQAFGKDMALVPANARTDGWIAGWNDDVDHNVPLALFTKGRWQAGYPCQALAHTAATLAARPADVKARLCLAEFYRLNGFDDYLADSGKPAADQLGGTPDLFPGKPVNRADLYSGVLAAPGASAEDTAYALYRAVMCYAPSGVNSCSREDVPLSQRKAWYQRLKRDYPKSPWAVTLKYYW